jgi:hypothetical protein
MSKYIAHEEYWRISAEVAADELHLELSDDQLQTLMECMYNASEMEYEATGDWIATRNFNAEQATQKERKRKEMLDYLHILFMNLKTVKVTTFGGCWIDKIKSDDASRAYDKLYDFLNMEY